MNIEELKALADQCICHPASRGIEAIESAGEGIKTLIADLESAKDERRALLATEQNLREKAERWDFLAERMLAADFDYAGEGVQALVFEMPAGFSASADAARTVDAARALLEKTT